MTTRRGVAVRLAGIGLLAPRLPARCTRPGGCTAPDYTFSLFGQTGLVAVTLSRCSPRSCSGLARCKYRPVYAVSDAARSRGPPPSGVNVRSHVHR